jgi:hypothetical protein
MYFIAFIRSPKSDLRGSQEFRLSLLNRRCFGFILAAIGEIHSTYELIERGE